MPLTVDQYSNFSAALEELSLQSVTPPQANAIAEELGLPALRALVARARDEDDKDALSLWIRAARARQLLAPHLDAQPTLTTVCELLRSVPSKRIHDAITDAAAGNPAPRRILSDWVADAQRRLHDGNAVAPARGTSPAAGGASTSAAPAARREPVHRTAVSPPVATPADQSTAAPRTVAAGASPYRAGAQAAATNVTPLRRAQTDDQPQTEDASSSRRYDDVKVFGRDKNGATALGFSRSNDNRTGQSTINVSIARALGQRTTEGCDWDRRIELKMTAGEVQKSLAVLMGYLAESRFAGHGPKNDKWMSIKKSQGPYAGSIMITIAQGQDYRSCAISPDDLGNVIAIFSRAVSDMHRSKTISQESLLRRVGQMAALAATAAEARKQRTG